MRSTRPSAFTLVELLVVIAIIGILIALLLPAVQAAREAGRRTTCHNNMHQLGIGIHSHHDTKGKLPVTIGGHTWAAYLLPFIEQENVYRQINFSVGWSHSSNQAAVNQKLEYLLCPSAPPGDSRIDRFSGGRTAAPGDYAPISDLKFAPIGAGLIPRPYNLDGALRNGKLSTWAHVRDGQSNTMLLVEDAGRPEFWIAGTTPGPANNVPGGGNYAVTNGRVRGAGWADAASSPQPHSRTWSGLRVPGPCSVNCSNNNEAYSFHPTGASALFGDGRVQLLNHKIALQVYAAMSTREGKEVFQMP